MTAIQEQAPRTPPRIVIRTFWLLHRALYRFSGGRVGLSRPRTGSRFGVMRLTTIGRRSGQPRLAMVGYYEDGQNLVTLGVLSPFWLVGSMAWLAHILVDWGLGDGLRTADGSRRR